MQVLRFTLIICSVAGLWLPLSWTSTFKHTVYTVHKMFLIFILFTFNLTQFMHAIFNINNSGELANTIYMMLTVFVAFYKMMIMNLSRENVTSLIAFLTEKPFAPLESREVTIRQKYDRYIHFTSLSYLSLVMTTVVCMIFTSVFMDFTKGNLTYPAWLPFNYTAPAVFLPVYVHQMIGMATCATVNVACDSLVCGLLQHICCQLEILEHRLTKITENQDALHDCVRHHNRIFQYAYAVNKQFVKIIAAQFGVSMLVVCSNLYQLAMTTFNANILPLLLYTACMLSQIFIYCWFGNEVKLKSLKLASNVFRMEWPDLEKNCQRNLMMIMKRTAIPIEFTSAYIISLNLDSFVSVLKTSYSAFNLLKQNSNE